MKLPDAHHEEVMDRANPEGGDKRTRLTFREVKEWVRDLTTQEVKSPRAGRRKDEPEQESRGPVGSFVRRSYPALAVGVVSKAFLKRSDALVRIAPPWPKQAASKSRPASFFTLRFPSSRSS